MTRHTGDQQECALSKLDPKEKGWAELVLREPRKEEWLSSERNGTQLTGKIQKERRWSSSSCNLILFHSSDGDFAVTNLTKGAVFVICISHHLEYNKIKGVEIKWLAIMNELSSLLNYYTNTYNLFL